MNNYNVILKQMNHWFVACDFKGIDPYQLDDKYFKGIKKLPGLKILRKMAKPFHSLIPKKVFTNCPGIYLSKALGLIIGGNANFYQLKQDNLLPEQNIFLQEKLKEIRSPGFNNYCWGVDLEWGQNVRLPPNTPLVCGTVPITNGLLDFYEVSNHKETLDICRSVAYYLLEENGWDHLDDNRTALYYGALSKNYAYNSNIMAAAFLYRLNQHIQDEQLIRFADKLINFVIDYQNADGSWYYSTNKNEDEDKIIDNRHTGFVLEALAVILKISPDEKVKQALEKGKNFYLNNFFDGAIPRWSQNQTYPVDIHDVAQAILTLVELEEYDKAKQVLDFSIEKMFNGKDEFYYKYFKSGTANRTVFIRWGQAWMYRAIAKFCLKSRI